MCCCFFLSAWMGDGGGVGEAASIWCWGYVEGVCGVYC